MPYHLDCKSESRYGANNECVRSGTLFPSSATCCCAPPPSPCPYTKADKMPIDANMRVNSVISLIGLIQPASSNVINVFSLDRQTKVNVENTSKLPVRFEILLLG